MENRKLLRKSSSGAVRKTDTVKDAKFFELALGTQLVFDAPANDTPIDQTTVTTEQEEVLIPFIPESRQVSFAGPAKWEEVYDNELKNESDRILRSYQKAPSEGEEFESNALSSVGPSSTTVVEENLSDRLGLGYLNPVRLTLTTESKEPIPVSLEATSTFRRSLTSAHFARMAGRLGLNSRSGGRNREERKHQELREKILPSSAGFSPEFYLSHVHANTSLEDLQEGLKFLEVELSKRTGQLKTLVKEHFEGFISCKNTIDDVQFRLKQNETQKKGVNTSFLKSSIAIVQSELSSTFAPILERQEKVEQLKNVMELLKRFKSSFNLPSNIRQLAENMEFSQVVSEYRRAKSLMGGAEVVTWRSLFEEVKKEASHVCLQISRKLDDPLLTPEEVQDLVICLCCLRHEGLEQTVSPEPLKQWIQSIELHLNDAMQKLSSKNQKCLEIQAQIQHTMEKSKKVRSITSPFEQSDSTVMDRTFDISMAEQWADYVSQLCKLILEYLPKLWKLQSNNTLQEIPTIAEDIQSSIVDQLFSIDSVSRGIFDVFNCRIMEAIEGILMADGLLSPPVFSVLKEIRLFASELKDCPEFVPSVLRDLIRECFDMCTTYLCTFLRQQMASLGEWEDWKIKIGSYCKNEPVTSVPFKLGASVREVMEQFKAIKAEQDQWPDNTNQIESTSLNHAFNECFESFALAVEGLAAAILEPNEPLNRSMDSMIEISKLLILTSNSMYIRKRLLPDLISQYSEFLYLTPGNILEESHLLKPFLSLENTMMATYTEHTKKLLDKAIDLTIAFEKDCPPLPIAGFHASVAPSEWLAVIIETQAEMLKYVPSKSNDVIMSMALHLIRKLKLRIQDLQHLGYLLQMYSDCVFLETVLTGFDVREIQKAWDAVYERLSTLVANQILRMKEESFSEATCTKEDVGWNVLNSFDDTELKDLSKLHNKLQRMFKDSVRDRLKKRSINLISLSKYKIKDRG